MDEERRTQLATDVAVIKEKVESLHDLLFGNGQPGMIEKLKGRLWRVEIILLLAGGILVGLGLLNIEVLRAMIP